MKYRSGKPGKRHKKVHFTKLSTKIYFTCITLQFKFYRLHFSVSKNISISNRLKKQEIFSLGIRHFSSFTCCLHNSISNHVNLNVHGLKQIQHEKSSGLSSPELDRSPLRTQGKDNFPATWRGARTRWEQGEMGQKEEFQ